MPLTTGQILNSRYRIVKLLGQGGFGAVYRAWDINLNIPVAIKENFDPSGESARQFALEANILAMLHHPNLPKVTDHFNLPGQGQYLVMEYIEGEDLAEKVHARHGPLPESQVVSWGCQILDALTYLHHQKPPIIHRDIKPGNLRITPHGQAILVDFGIAKVSAAGSQTMAAAKAVTVGYSPIENYGSGMTDARSDLYALGATLYCALTGIDPPESTDRMTGSRLVPIRQVNPAISPQVEAAVSRAMEIQPGNRFQSADAFMAALRAQPAPAAPAPVGPTQVIVGRIPARPTPSVAPTQVIDPRTLDLGAALPEDAPSTAPNRLPLYLVSGGALAAVGLLIATVLFIWSMGTRGADPTATAASVAAVPTATSTSVPIVNLPTAGSSAVNLIPTSTPYPNYPSAPTYTPFVVPTLPPAPDPLDPGPTGPLMLALDRNYHCRGGPAEYYDVLRDLSAGEQYELIGLSYDGDWYLVRLNDPRTRKKLCWVGGGDILGIPVGLPHCQWEGDGYTEDYFCSQ